MPPVRLWWRQPSKPASRRARTSRATVAGRFVQPPARAEMMYDGAVWGRSPGARVVVEPKAEAAKAEGTKAP